jgi:Werner syndrome ATP-dependent helicase
MELDHYEQAKSKTVRYNKIKKILKDVYSYDNFRSNQYEIINRVVNQEDVCAVMPTGHGKSICFQIPALYLDKPSIVVSPLISLMEDQQINLKKVGIDSCCYNSTVNGIAKKMLRSEILSNKYKIIYITPEMITKCSDLISQLQESCGISLFAIDEAHCISSFGCDFRESYRELNCLKTLYPDIPILAVTATATESVIKDICKVLCLNEPNIIKSSFDRPNLSLNVSLKSSNIVNDLLPLLKKYHDKSIIIFCITRKETESVAQLLKSEISTIKCESYHAGMSTDDRNKIHHKFISGKINCIVATIAFGMGIDKKDVRLVIHYGCPKNIEAYYQEIGRAGRDGNASECCLFYTPRDFKLHRFLIDKMDNDKFKDSRLKLLIDIEKFITSNECRRKNILKYFGDVYDKDNCKNCDNCIRKSENKFTNIDISMPTLLLINCIITLGGYFGSMVTIGVLRGSNNKKIPFKYKKSSIFGKGSKYPDAWWKCIINILIQKEYIREVTIKDSNVPFGVSRLNYTNKGMSWYQSNNHVLELEETNFALTKEAKNIGSIITNPLVIQVNSELEKILKYSKK